MAEFVFPSFLIFTCGFLLLHSLKHQVSAWLKSLAFFLCAVCVYSQLHGIGNRLFWVENDEFKSVYGEEYHPFAFLHWHEQFHYYLGTKYFEELGYFGLYEAAIVADSEKEQPIVTTNRPRSLRDTLHLITYDEAYRRGTEEFRPRFTDERWQSFKDDLEALLFVGNTQKINHAMNDLGFHPPPTWIILGRLLTNTIPIQEKDAFIKDARPYWYQVLWVPYVDIALITIALIFVYRTFGALAVMGYLCIFCTAFLGHPNWTLGSMLRWTWVSEMTIAMCMVKRGRYIPAGMLMAIAGLDRIFPLAFTAGMAIPLFWNAYRKKIYKPFLQYTAAASLTAVAWVSLSIALFGLNAWKDFIVKISLHKWLIYAHSMGYKVILGYTPELGATHYTIEWDEWMRQFMEGLAPYMAWYYLSSAFIVGACFVACLRLSAIESCFLFGTTMFFITQAATSYYYLQMPLAVIVLLDSRPSRGRTGLLLMVFLFQFLTWIPYTVLDDELREYYYCCWFFLIYLLIWIGVRMHEHWGHPIHWRQLLSRLAPRQGGAG